MQRILIHQRILLRTTFISSVMFFSLGSLSGCHHETFTQIDQAELFKNVAHSTSFGESLAVCTTNHPEYPIVVDVGQNIDAYDNAPACLITFTVGLPPPLNPKDRQEYDVVSPADVSCSIGAGFPVPVITWSFTTGGRIKMIPYDTEGIVVMLGYYTLAPNNPNVCPVGSFFSCSFNNGGVIHTDCNGVVTKLSRPPN